MKTLKNTAETLNIFCKIAFYVCITGAILLAVTIAVVAIGGEEIITEEGVATLTLGVVNFEIANEYFSDFSMVKQQFCLTFGISTIIMLFVSFFLKFVQKILKPLIEEKPFDGTLSKNIAKLANYVLIGGAVSSAISTVIQSLILKNFDLERLFISEKIVGIRIDNDLDLTFVWIYLIIRILAIVFKYGEELQKQSDETL